MSLTDLMVFVVEHLGVFAGVEQLQPLPALADSLASMELAQALAPLEQVCRQLFVI